MKPKEQALSSVALIHRLHSSVRSPSWVRGPPRSDRRRRLCGSLIGHLQLLLPAGKSHPIQQSQSIGVFWLARTHFSLSSKNTGRTFATRF